MRSDLCMVMKRRNGELEQLLKQDPVAMGMLGKQAVCNQVYRPLTYVLTVQVVNKKVFYNLLTHEMIAVNMDELDLSETRKYFIENWYLVPDKHDDQQLVDECRAVLTLMNSGPKKVHSFNIFTTLDCNARCFYCFEKRMIGSNMTMETASRVIEYMQEQADGDPINIIWFGGEPLFNYPVIDFITSGLRDKGLYFESDIISNGLLFDSWLVEKAKNLWGVKYVQITLDGTSQVYKRVKAYVTDVEDPFRRVLQNIKNLLKAEIKVSIRLNVGLHNYRDIWDLVRLLCEEFEVEKNIYVYASLLYEVRKYTDEKKAFMYDLLEKLNSKMESVFGNKKEKKISEEFSGKIINSCCMATGREAVTILPDGKVGICTSVTDGALLGDIYMNEIDPRLREDFGRRFYREDKCRPCPMYPNCYIVNGCPNRDILEGCDSVSVKNRIRRIKEKMKNKCRLGTSKNEAEFAQQMRKGEEQSGETEI